MTSQPFDLVFGSSKGQVCQPAAVKNKTNRDPAYLAAAFTYICALQLSCICLDPLHKCPCSSQTYSAYLKLARPTRSNVPRVSGDALRAFVVVR